MSEPRTPAQVLREARQQDSRTKRARVLSVVDQLLADNEPVTFTGVARAANVSHWLVYADGVREHIEAARRRQECGATNDARTGAREPAGWKVEKQLLQGGQPAPAARGRAPQGRRPPQSRQQLDQIGAADLGARVDELTAENQRLQQERDKALAHVQTLTEQLSEVQDDLGSARLSLRRMIRTENQAPSPGGRQSP